MDQPGHPDSGPAGAGDESRDASAGGWQPSSNGRFRDPNGRDPNGRDPNGRDSNGRADGIHRVPGTRTADTPWSSAGAALEPLDDDGGWRRSLASGLRGRAEVRSR